MAFSVVQQNAPTAVPGPAAAVAIFPTPAASGDLLIISATQAFTGTGASDPGFITPSGWTKIGQQAVDGPPGSSTLWTAYYYKAAAGGETSVTIDSLSYGDQFYQSYAGEFGGFTGKPTLDVHAETVVNSSVNSVSETVPDLGHSTEMAWSMMVSTSNQNQNISSILPTTDYYFGPASGGTKYQLNGGKGELRFTAASALAVTPQANSQFSWTFGVDIGGSSSAALLGATFYDHQGGGLTMPQQAILLSLADPWTPPDFTDITPLAKKWSGKVRGRQHELQRFEAGNINITLNNNDGRFSPWNTNGPFYNLLRPDDAATAATAPADNQRGTWQNAGGISTFENGAPPVTLDGPQAVKLIATGGTGALRTATDLYPVAVGKAYTAMCSFLAATTPRAWTVGIEWYEVDGVTLISTTTGSAVNDNTTTWTKATVVSALAPALAAYASVILTGASLGAAEVHWEDRKALFNTAAMVPSTAWAPGQRELSPTRPIHIQATWNAVTYDVFYGYVDNWTPQYARVMNEQTISVTDGLKLLALAYLDVSTYVPQVESDGVTGLFELSDLIGSPSAADAITGNLGTVYGGVAFGAVQPLLTSAGTGASFDGSTGYIALPPSASYVIGTDWTLEDWVIVPPANVGSFMDVLVQSSPGGGNLVTGLLISNIGHLVAQCSADGVLSGAGYGEIITGVDVCDGDWHLVGMKRSGTMLTAYVDGTPVATTTLTDNTPNTAQPMALGVGLAPGADPYLVGGFFHGGMALAGIYGSTALTDAQMLNHYDLGSAGWVVENSGTRIAVILETFGWPSNMQTIATGDSIVQAATSPLTGQAALAYIQLVEGTEQGAFYCDGLGYAIFRDRHYILTAPAATVSNGTFANDNDSSHFQYIPGIVPADDDIDLWNDVPSQRQGGVLQRAQNPNSITQYRRRTLQGFTTGLQIDDAENLAQAQWLLAHYGLPITRVRQITVNNTSAAGANFPQMLGRKILDKITVSWQPIDGTDVPFVQDSLIEAITHTVTQDTWETVWALTPAETQGYLVLDDPVYGTLDSNRLAY